MNILDISDKVSGQNIICVIPARYGSTRFPGKPLAKINGRPMIQWVWERAVKSRIFKRIIIATDDARILNAAKSFGAQAVMTSGRCRTGTDRVAEVARKIAADIVVNLQGDEPAMSPGTIAKSVEALVRDKDAVAATPVCLATDSRMGDPNVVKVVFDKNRHALYFSRSIIPSTNGEAKSFYKHIGLYAYRKDFLRKFVKMPQTPLEKKEKLEQLRILENGYKIRIVEVKLDTVPVDRPSDIKRIKKILA